jgi:hypothetical protein
MNFLSCKRTLLIAALITAPMFAKRPKKEKPPKEPRPALTEEQKQIIGANIGQVMGSLCAIAQDPRNPHNIGASVASIIQALIAVIVEKFARRSININDTRAVEECLNELLKEINKEITKITINGSIKK